jgi:hypothetical protein
MQKALTVEYLTLDWCSLTLETDAQAYLLKKNFFVRMFTDLKQYKRASDSSSV